ncbi:LytR/AlgR family response regulator transcription factor [Flectobacillus longus]|uniref:LytR/AlgR family response regulator transcription factor n=1 Tax=Flectobacillus longus TaxID=2984207 RepID=UPI0024B6FFBB|nr:response regulator transcription factor [Flectobacillus longus]MDI9878376.1 response regulator transcription factor [Flectobacillus longus]
MQKENKGIYLVKTLIITSSDTEFLHIKSFLSDEKFEALNIVSDVYKLNTYKNEALPDLIICDFQILDKSIIEILSNNFFLEVPILFISGEAVEDKVFELVKMHPRNLFLIKPLHELTFKTSLNLLLNAYPPRSRNYVEVINRNHQILKIRYEEILYIKAEGNYTFINTIDRKVFARKKPLKMLKEELGNTFIQINKSHIINMTFIKRVELGRGILLVDDKEVKIGRAFRRKLNQFLKKP